MERYFGEGRLVAEGKGLPRGLSSYTYAYTDTSYLGFVLRSSMSSDTTLSYPISGIYCAYVPIPGSVVGTHIQDSYISHTAEEGQYMGLNYIPGFG